MIIWFLIGGLAVLVVAFTTLMVRRSAPLSGREVSLAIYRQQMDEVEADRVRGLLNDEEAAAARAEVGRRMLKADLEARDDIEAKDSSTIPVVLVAITLLVGGVLYAAFGQPGLPDSARTAVTSSTPKNQEGEPDMRQLVVELEKELARSPERLDGWLLLGRSAAGIGQYQRAARAYQKAVELEPDNAEHHVALAQALMAHAEGRIVPAARLAFERAAAIDPNHPAPRYYAGVAQLQAGEPERAAEIWQAMLDGAAEGAPWRQQVESQLRRVQARLNRDNPPPGPSREQMAQMSQLPEEEQQAFIRSMVEGLAAKLEENPEDLDGWLRLARARMVLGEREKAIEALTRAQALAPPELARQLQNQVSALESGEQLN